MNKRGREKVGKEGAVNDIPGVKLRDKKEFGKNMI